MGDCPSVYRYADQLIESQIEIDELLKTSTGSRSEKTFIVTITNSLPEKLVGLEWIPQQDPSSSPPCHFLARSGNSIFLRFSDLADFAISNDGTTINILPQPGTSDETVRHLLLDQVLPRILDHQGKLVVHAGAVRVDNLAIAFLGKTGTGKSTLTASFNLGGYPLLSDDGVLITAGPNGAMALPTYPSLRLWLDTVAGLYPVLPQLTRMAHNSSKQRVLISEHPDAEIGALPLAALFLLAPTENDNTKDAAINRLSPTDACMTIISNSFQLDVDDKQRAADRLNISAQVTELVPVFKLEYVRNFSSLPALRTAILKHIGHA